MAIKPNMFAVLLWFLLFIQMDTPATAQGEPLPLWEEGYLDIHHISTGCGDCTFCILPDGTTLLVDAGGRVSNAERQVPARPNAERTPGDWIVDYIIRHFPMNRTKQIDYFLSTHFHLDHLAAFIDIAQSLPISKIIDRGYPDYMLRRPGSNEIFFHQYLRLANQLESKSPGTMEQFKVGSNKQFILNNDPERYAGSFEIRNLIANGVMWTGKEEDTTSLFPSLEGITGTDFPEENSLSCAIKLSYGQFDYYTGGDLTGYPKPGRPQWHDLETPLAPVIGPVEVCVINHHGYNNATNDTFIKTLVPEVFIISASDALHPNHSTLYRMLAKELYPADRDVFSTNLHSAARVVIGSLTDRMKSTQGHIVIRVSPGGSNYSVYILDDSQAESIAVKAVYGPYLCK